MQSALLFLKCSGSDTNRCSDYGHILHIQARFDSSRLGRNLPEQCGIGTHQLKGKPKKYLLLTFLHH